LKPADRSTGVSELQHVVGRVLIDHATARIAEILLPGVVAWAIVTGGWALVGDAPLAHQVVVWLVNVLMLIWIWLGLRVRGQTWEHFGLRRLQGLREVLRTLLQALTVFIAAMLAFVVGALVMTRWMPTTPPADMSDYAYLQGNLPLLLLALAAVFVVSSFGEEAIYRGFLMNRLAELLPARSASLTAVGISSVAFGLVHFSWGIVGVVQTTLMGVALATAYLVVRRNLWVLVLAHAFMDSLLLIQLYLGPPPA
jgi:membrane protease YdiL (CAAX protease family)